MNCKGSIFLRNFRQTHVFFVILIINLLNINVDAQISRGGVPESFQLEQSTEDDTVYSPATPFSLSKSAPEDKQYIAYEFGKILPFNQRLGDPNFGTQIIDSNGNKIWKATITSKNALALGLYFSNFYLPEGAKLFIYAPDKKQLIGAFTSLNNSQSYLFATELILGDQLVIEYNEPAAVAGLGHFTIDEVLHAYRGVSDFKSGFGSSGSCEVNVNCSEGSPYVNQRNSVVRLLIKEGNSSFWCTGSVINNVKNDRTPYVLTADHCGALASYTDLGQWVFYFNYQSTNCENPGTEPTRKTMTGATKIAASSNSGSMGSDFYLVLLNQNIPDEYKPYYVGWDRTGNVSSSGVSIHHPQGDIKKISTYTKPLVSTTYVSGSTSGMANASWEVTWSATENGHGVTEGGSSGCPIYSQNGYLVGTLTGGWSSCSNQDAEDYYGKFDYHWEKNGTSPDTQLKPWLDPDDTGIQIISGIYCETDTIPPTFSAPTSITINCDDDPYDLLITGDVLNEQDNCAVNQATYSDSIDNTNHCEIVITRTWSLSDNSGNSAADQIQIITMQDVTAPTFTPPNDIIINCDDDASDLNITGDVTNEADNCDDSFLNATYTDSYSSADPCSAIITRTWMLSDNCNNTTTHNQIIQISNNFFNVFPNPSNGEIKVRFNASAFGKTVNIRVSNRLGQYVYKESVTINNQLDLNLNYLQKGIYFITIEGDTQRQTQKISIQ